MTQGPTEYNPSLFPTLNQRETERVRDRRAAQLATEQVRPSVGNQTPGVEVDHDTSSTEPLPTSYPKNWFPRLARPETVEQPDGPLTHGGA